MAKMLLWIGVGLATAAILFVTVWTLSPKPPPKVLAGPIDEETAERLRQSGPGDPDAAIPIDRVYGILWDDWDRAENRFNFRFHAKEFEPLTGNRGRFVKPVYVLYRYGQTRTVTMKLEADELISTYERKSKGSSQIRPIEGKMIGNVRIVVDRGNPKKIEKDNVIIYMDDLQFRDKMRMFTTDGPVKIRSREMDIDGIGLIANRTEGDEQFQDMRIIESGRMVIRQGLGRFGLVDETKISPVADIKTKTKTKTKPKPAATKKVKKTDKSEKDKTPRESQSYRCIFYGPNIKVVMGTRILIADERMVVDFQMETAQPTEDKDSAKAKKDKKNKKDKSTSTTKTPATPATRPTEPVKRKKQQVTVITWNGEMHLMPLPKTKSDKKQRERFNLVATGKRVSIQEQEALAVGEKFIYDNLSEAGLLLADKRDAGDERFDLKIPEDQRKKVTVNWSNNLTLRGDRVRFDMTNGKAAVIGKGKLEAPMDPDAPAGKDNLVVVRWEKQIRLDSRTYAGVDRHGQPAEKMVFEAAHFEKGVSFEMPDGTHLTGDNAQVDFYSPEEIKSRAAARPAGEKAGKSKLPPFAFKNIVIRENARMKYGSQDITGDKINIEMALDDRGRANPKRLIATGNVVSREDFRVTKADRLEATVTIAETENVLFKNGKPVTVRKRKMLIGDIFAKGKIDSFDTREGYRVIGTSLTRTAKTKLVRIEGKPARVFTSTNLIQAPAIVLNQTTRGMSVSTAGRMVLLSDRDLQGNNVRTRYRIQWGRNMDYQPSKDMASFAGNVTVLTRSDISEGRVDCDRLRLKMKPRSRENAPATQPGAARQAASLGPAAGMGRLEHVDARKNVVVILDDLDPLGLPTQRTRISGQHLVLNNEHQTVRVAGVGNLYWYGRGNGVFRAVATGAAQAGDQPTRIISTWKDQLLYHIRTRKADLDGDARVVILGRQALAANMGLAAGRAAGKTILLGDKIILAFKTTAGAGELTGGMMPTMGSGGGLKHVLASGQVYGEYNELTVTGSKLDFDVLGGKVKINGSKQNDAQLYRMSATGKVHDHFVGPALTMNTRTGELDASRSRLRYYPEAGMAMQGALQ